MNDKEKFKLGLFVISGIVVLIVGITFMGLLDDFKPKAHLVTYVNESVQGLTVGSKVRFMGVPIGEIREIGIILGDSQVRIDMDIDLTKVYAKKNERLFRHSNVSKDKFYDFLKKEVTQGLACRIEPEGITGAKYVEIDYYIDRQKDKKITPAITSGDYLYLPSTPSMIANLKVSVFEILASIAAVDFKGISAQLHGVLTKTNRTIERANLEQLVTRINQITNKLDEVVSNINRSVTPEKMDALMKNINNAFQSVKTLSVQLNQIAQQAKVPETSTSIRDLSDSLQENSASLQETLQKANEAMDALTDLIHELSDNPASLVRGKRANKDAINY